MQLCKTCKEKFDPLKREVICDECKQNTAIDRKVKNLIQEEREWWWYNDKEPEPLEDEANPDYYKDYLD